MNPEELRTELNKRDLVNLQLAPHIKVVDAKKFVEIQFIEVEKWKGDLQQCPAWQRLLLYWERLQAV